MGYTKDLWTRPVKLPDGSLQRDSKGKVVREPTKRWGTGKRWLACWLDPEKQEKTKAFHNFKAADHYQKAQQTDVERGDYHDPKAGREQFDTIAKRWLKIRQVDPKSAQLYARVYRLHIKPEFGNRRVNALKTSEVQELLSDISPGNRGVAHMILVGIFELARLDGMIKRNPASGKAIQLAKPPQRRVRAWGDDKVTKLIDAHPLPLQLAPIILAGCGLREGELYGLSVDDIEDGDDPVIHVRRQIKRLDGGVVVFAMPKGDKERAVPLSGWVAQAIATHPVKPLTMTLPWETGDGPLVTHQLLVSQDGDYMRPGVYDRVWKPALHAAGLIGDPVKSARGRMRYPTDRHAGRHALRHYYASIELAGGVNIRELAEYMGHDDPGFTLRVYGHMLPDSHERARKAIDSRLFRPRAVGD